MPQPVVAKKYHYLALGDSYTIGEMVAPPDNFPGQVYSLMKSDTVNFQPARIIAKTGWTTDELETGILAASTADPLRPSYDFVSLLIGVNNQYRGRSVDSYKPAFEELLKKAIRFAGDRASQSLNWSASLLLNSPSVEVITQLLWQKPRGYQSSFEHRHE